MNRSFWLLAASGLLLLAPATGVVAGDVLKPVELLTMRGFSGNTCPAETFAGARAIDHRLHADGTHAPFVIPPGQVFVVTEVIFRVSGAAQTTTQVRLGTPCEAPSSGCMQLWLDSVVSVAESFDDGESQVSLRHGFPIAHGVPICVASLGGNPNTFASLHGYLAKAQ